MKRFFAVALLIAVASSANAQTRLWLGGPTPGDVPMLDGLQLGDEVWVDIWAQTDPAEGDNQLLNVSLNLVSSDPNVVDWHSIDFLNPVLVPQSGFPPKDVVRFEFVNDSSSNPPLEADANGDLVGASGFSVTGKERTGAGIGGLTTGLDPDFNSDTGAFLLARAHGWIAHPGHTDLNLQIGENGLNYNGERSSDVTVVFGDSVNDPLNGEADRGVSSDAADGVIWAEPEPGSIVLLLLGSLGLGLVRRRKA